jgi:hypothetical protein
MPWMKVIRVSCLVSKWSRPSKSEIEVMTNWFECEEVRKIKHERVANPCTFPDGNIRRLGSESRNRTDSTNAFRIGM